MLRLTNLIKLSNSSTINMWKIVKKVKTDRRMEDYHYGCENGLFNDPLTQVEAVEQRMGINSSLIRFENVTKQRLHFRACMIFGSEP